MTPADDALDRLERSLRTCPDHGLPDCSPLLNGCNLVNQNHDALATVRDALERLREERDALKTANRSLVRINGGLRGLDDPEDDHWCAVEGCQNKPTMYEFQSDEFVCDEHVYYGAVNARAEAAEAELQAVVSVLPGLPNGRTPSQYATDEVRRLTELESELGAHKLMLADERRWRAEAEAEITRLRGLLTEWDSEATE